MEKYSRDYAINLLLVSIAEEELALAHILRAEGDKINFVICKLKECVPPAIAVEKILETNESVRKTIIAAIKKEMLLEFKLENVLAIKSEHHH